MNSEEAIEDAIAKLHDPLSNKRRAAAKLLRRAADPRAGSALLQALEREFLDRRTWETQYQLIMALAACQTKAAAPLLERALSMTLEPAVHVAAGDALVRISDDVDSAVRAALASEALPRIEGAARALAMTRAVTARGTFESLVRYASVPPHHQTRFWVAAAAAGCRSPLVQEFLEECLRDTNVELKRAAEASLRGRFLKWNPL